MFSVTEARRELNRLISSEEPELITQNGAVVSALVPYSTFCQLSRAHRILELQEAVLEAEKYKSGEKGRIDQEEFERSLRMDENDLDN